jgi:hypothetical protein
MIAFCFRSFRINTIEVAFDGNNVVLSVEKLEANHAEKNFALVALKNVGSVNFATGSPTMQSTSWR